MFTTEIAAPGPDGWLRGTLLAPKGGGAPVVLMLPGSGPVDRDGNSPSGIHAGPLRLLAQELAARGVASVRVDKRGMFGSAGAVPDPNDVTIGDYAADVHAWIDVIRQRLGMSGVWLLGHSEGGLVALAAAASDAASINGLILVATAGRPVGTLLREQLHRALDDSDLLAQALCALAHLETGRHLDTAGLHPALLPLFAPSVQGFLIDEMTLDPVALVASVARPVLVVQGDQDLQVGLDDARLLANAGPHTQCVVLPDTNHVLKQVGSDQRAANLATYADPSLPLGPRIGPAIVAFITNVAGDR
ncbi:alpha/beta hydrolase [Chitinasiproducens palmae]|uniref:Serine aminopeptidase S33 domain-containing protein n=1 Tax=Chitinasiproducens palmae TaxID=1770053 RepID=A0A1H2PKC4_9BURK|nr:alpha/beta fold hydrolase [Chitinasiproducens palmae]SDV46905.1 hypothetical protein SAMN05216551_10289 [Chitinasiproducens palmae]